MGPVSAGNALVAVDDRSVDGATDPSHAHTAPASHARHEEREEKGEEPRGGIGPYWTAVNAVLTASTSEAYALLFKLLCDPGNEVLVPRPS